MPPSTYGFFALEQLAKEYKTVGEFVGICDGFMYYWDHRREDRVFYPVQLTNDLALHAMAAPYTTAPKSADQRLSLHRFYPESGWAFTIGPRIMSEDEYAKVMQLAHHIFPTQAARWT